MQTLSNNLNTFRILYIVKGILTLFIAPFFLAYMFIGEFIASIDDVADEIEHLPFNPLDIFVVIGGIGFVLTLIWGILTILASKYINEKRNYSFIMVVAVLNCFTGILGILLGIFTIVELNKPHIRQLFEEEQVLS